MGLSSSSPKAAEATEFVNKTIADHAVVVFSKSYCPYCFKAVSDWSNCARCRPSTVFGSQKDALAKHNVDDIVVVELDERSDGSAIQSALGSMTGRSTVPNVFIGGSSIGGGDETAALQQSGKLAGLLSSAVSAKSTPAS